MTLSLISPAKINLFLRIVRRREDGYHELASLFQAISLFDTLHFRLSEKDSLTCSDPTLPTDQSNLIAKALASFRYHTNLHHPVSIHVEKRIPQQAGLGGGSSNAATTLWGMNQLLNQPISEAQLIQWGGEIGSDVPFFLSEGTAYCTGRGEILRSLLPLPKQRVVIVKPPQGLSTPLVFKNLILSELSARDPEVILDNFLKGDPIYFNDLELPSFRLLPFLAKLKIQLQEDGFSTVLMSGSGSSFFCLKDGKMINRDSYTSYSAEFINRSTGQWFCVE